MTQLTKTIVIYPVKDIARAKTQFSSLLTWSPVWTSLI
jgi:hypothetical protein